MTNTMEREEIMRDKYIKLIEEEEKLLKQLEEVRKAMEELLSDE